MGQHVPLAASRVEVEKRIEHLAYVHFPRTPAALGRRNQWLDDRPLLVGMASM